MTQVTHRLDVWVLGSISAGILAGLAGIIHLAAGTQHLAEAPVLGWGMLAVGVAQLAAAWLLWTRPSPRLAGLVLAGTLLALAIFALQHTLGLPGLAHAEAHQETAAHTHDAGHADHHATDAAEAEWREPLALANLATETLLVVVLLPLVVQPPRG